MIEKIINDIMANEIINDLIYTTSDYVYVRQALRTILKKYLSC